MNIKGTERIAILIADIAWIALLIGAFWNGFDGVLFMLSVCVWLSSYMLIKARRLGDELTNGGSERD